MFKKALFTFGFILIAATTFAQTAPHPCDATPPTDYTVNGGQLITIGFCHNGKDVNGAPVTVTSFVLVINGTRYDLGAITPTGSPNANGESYYQLPPTPATASGTISVIAANSIGESLPSTAINVTVASLPAVPTSPLKTRINVG